VVSVEDPYGRNLGFLDRIIIIIIIIPRQIISVSDIPILVASAVLPNLKVVSVSKFLLMMAYD
jgi:hypothetical protein